MLHDFETLESTLHELKNFYSESPTIQLAWCEVRQEKFLISKISEGMVSVWGTGKNGQLGLGPSLLSLPHPKVIPLFKHRPITKIAAGHSHVLAIDTDGRLYSWGGGKSGKLGHGDLEDRFQPETVKYLDKLFVEDCSAGDAHSAVLTTDRKVSRKGQLRRISCWGRGAHGRLGNGTNLTKSLPVLVNQLLPSLEGCQFRQIACGGAHTVALASRPLAKGLANPFGEQTFVIAWGFGTNGQLGDGRVRDSMVPTKAIMPKCELVAEISAGRSWTIARTINGEVYSWGKGLRGQLGQGKSNFSYVPRKLSFPAAFVKISSGYSHNVCITASNKYVSEKIQTKIAQENKANILYDPFKPLVDLTLRKKQSISVTKFVCRRRLFES